jgi:hypothetical protein
MASAAAWRTPVKEAASSLPSGSLSPTESLNTELVSFDDEQDAEQDPAPQLRTKQLARGDTVDSLCHVLDMLQVRVCAREDDGLVEDAPPSDALTDYGDGARPAGYLSLWFEYLAKATRASDRTLTAAVMQLLRVWGKPHGTDVILQPRTVRRTMCVALLVQCRHEEPHGYQWLYGMLAHWAGVCEIPLEHLQEGEARYLDTIDAQVAISPSRVAAFLDTIPRVLAHAAAKRGSPPPPVRDTTSSVPDEASNSRRCCLRDDLAMPDNIFGVCHPAPLFTLPDESSFVELHDLDDANGLPWFPTTGATTTTVHCLRDPDAVCLFEADSGLAVSCI